MFFLIIKKYIYRIKVSKKIINLILKKTSLVATPVQKAELQSFTAHEGNNGNMWAKRNQHIVMNSMNCFTGHTLSLPSTGLEAEVSNVFNDAVTPAAVSEPCSRGSVNGGCGFKLSGVLLLGDFRLQSSKPALSSLIESWRATCGASRPCKQQCRFSWYIGYVTPKTNTVSWNK